MKVTQNLKLPQYTEDDVFDLTVINEAHNKIDTAYKEIDTTYKEIANLREEIPKVNANAEIIDARGGQTTLGDKIRNIDSQLDTNLNEIFDARGNEKNLKTRLDKMDNDLDNIENNYALKSEIGAPTDEQVDNWLTSHPEATTTVQDNSISWNKLTSELKVNLNNLVKSTVFNSDGSIKEVFNDNYYKLTTMNSNKIIEKWYTDTNSLLFTKTTTLNSDGSISEALV